MPDDERVLLNGFLDRQRAVAVRKIEGLSDSDAAREVTSTGVTLLGTLKHLEWDERCWFAHHLLGTPPPADDGDESFVIRPGDTVESVVARYGATCDESRRITAATSLDEPCAIAHWAFGTPTLRWVLLHMIEETARHAGHMDLLREQTDGATGV
jgi:hypothetical protein